MSVPHLPGAGRLHITESSQSLSDLFPWSELTRLQTGSKATILGLSNTNNKASGLLRPHLQEARGSRSSTLQGQTAQLRMQALGSPGAGNWGGWTGHRPGPQGGSPHAVPVIQMRKRGTSPATPEQLQQQKLARPRSVTAELLSPAPRGLSVP